MTGVSAARAENANRETVKVGGVLRQDWRFVRLIAPLGRQRFKSNVAAEFAFITNRKVRNVEKWLAGTVEPNGEATLRIVLSEIGGDVLEAGLARLQPDRAIAVIKALERGLKRADRALRIAAILAEVETDR